MSHPKLSSRRLFLLTAASSAAVLASSIGLSAKVRSTGFMQSVAEASSGDKAIFAFYKANGYQPIWTGQSSKYRARRQALLKALAAASNHGLPKAAYSTEFLKVNLRSVRSDRDLGRVEVTLSKLFLDYARDIQSGVLNPPRVDEDIARKVPLRDRLSLLVNFSKSSPVAYLRRLPPSNPEYIRLMKQKLIMERLVARGGWGASVPGRKLKIGDSGTKIVALRNRLFAMGFMRRNASRTFDQKLHKGVQQFQLAHGLSPDGVAGRSTLGEINVLPEKRLASIIVAMERERWMNFPRGKRHILVDLADFSTSIIDDGKVTFKTVTVVGANKKDRRSPEFSDSMEHMVLNPTWNVPRSITVKEYLPLMQEDPTAVGHLEMYDQSGEMVSRDNLDFNDYTEEDFPFDLKQPPSRGNALGLVKFMLPNRFNIYLHDTPEKSLFGYEARAFSHGCIRLSDPFEFAYALLRRQVSNPEEYFQTRLASGEETVIPLKEHIPVHLVYRTALATPKGKIEFRRDFYGRDAKIFAALQKAGVVLRAVRS